MNVVPCNVTLNLLMLESKNFKHANRSNYKLWCWGNRELTNNFGQKKNIIVRSVAVYLYLLSSLSSKDDGKREGMGEE